MHQHLSPAGKSIRGIICSIIFIAASMVAEGGEDHPLKLFFTSPILSLEKREKVMTKFEVPSTAPYRVACEVYHTDLDVLLVGMLVSVSCEQLDLTYDVIIPLTAGPYSVESGQAYLFRGKEVFQSNPQFRIKEIRYQPLPEIENQQ